jgi:hypothetical protein
MSKLISIYLLLVLATSCTRNSPIVERSFVDSLVNNPGIEATDAKEKEVSFWKNRIDMAHPGITNESRYAAALASRFAVTGDIKDMWVADSVLYAVNERFNNKEASPFKMLAAHAITRHRFMKADSLLNIARKIGLKAYDETTATFDVYFELGRYTDARSILHNIKDDNDYGYKFRQSKIAHYLGDIDSAVSYMLKAAALAGNSPTLKQTALSNAADLYLHSGEFKKAYSTYKTSIQLGNTDNHSLLGLGWIALVHDKNDSLAKAIFSYVQSKTKLPDPLYKLSQACQLTNDTVAELQYANEFVTQSTDTLYGGLYNKYLIELYTGILQNPSKAEGLAKAELLNRATPQTYAWYAWALFCNGKKEEAYKVYNSFVSGKPLEALELYYMGNMMKGLGKGYNAMEFFKAANRNRYDLSPRMMKTLIKNLEE